MFSRLTAESRQLLVASQLEARRLRHDFLGCEHLLLAMTRQGAVAPILADAGVRYDALEAAVRHLVGTVELDSNALAVVGIDLAAVRARVEETFGIGALEAAAFALDPRAAQHRCRRSRNWFRRRRHRPPEPARPCTSGLLPFTARAKQALERALRISQGAGTAFINPDHIALAVLTTNEGVIPDLLNELGVVSMDLQHVLEEWHDGWSERRTDPPARHD